MRAEIPLYNNRVAPMVPWIIAVMVYLVIVTTALSVLMNKILMANPMPLEVWTKSQIVILIACCLGSLLIYGVAFMMIIFTTHTNIALHDGVINILQLIGASDRYIIKIFQNNALKTTFQGSLLGGGLAAVTFIFLLYWDTTYMILIDYRPQKDVWLTILMTPLIILLLTGIAARLTILFALARRS